MTITVIILLIMMFICIIIMYVCSILSVVHSFCFHFILFRVVSFRVVSFYILRLMNFKCSTIVNAKLLFDTADAVDGKMKVNRALYMYVCIFVSVRVDSIFFSSSFFCARTVSLFESSNVAIDIWLQNIPQHESFGEAAC